MLRKFLRLGGDGLAPGNENAAPEQAPVHQGSESAGFRSFATGAALAVSADYSPAVLVSIYDYAHRYRDKPSRRAG